MLVRAIQENDEDAVHAAVLRLSQSRRLFAPLAFVVGAFVMLFQGLRLLVSNWRLTVIQILPAVWIWLALYDLKAHVLHGKSYNDVRGPILIPINLAIVAITAGCFFLNAVFALAIARSGPPTIRPAFEEARRRAAPILTWGAAVGVLLGLSVTVVTRYGPPWFTLSLGIVIGVMMICYVAVPSRLVGVRPTYSRRDKLAAGIVGGAIGALVCAPGYLIGRLGLVLLGSHRLFALGVILLILGFALQAGTTSAVKTVKMSAKLIAGQPVDTGQPKPPASAANGTGTG